VEARRARAGLPLSGKEVFWPSRTIIRQKGLSADVAESGKNTGGCLWTDVSLVIII
jgi:hypothetical protein